jgi:hypothetical protein
LLPCAVKFEPSCILVNPVDSFCQDNEETYWKFLWSNRKHEKSYAMLRWATDKICLFVVDSTAIDIVCYKGLSKGSPGTLEHLKRLRIEV